MSKGTYKGETVVNFRPVDILGRPHVEYQTPESGEDEYVRVSTGDWARYYRPVHTGKTRFAGNGCRLRTDEDEYLQKVY